MTLYNFGIQVLQHRISSPGEARPLGRHLAEHRQQQARQDHRPEQLRPPGGQQGQQAAGETRPRGLRQVLGHIREREEG